MRTAVKPVAPTYKISQNVFLTILGVGLGARVAHAAPLAVAHAAPLAVAIYKFPALGFDHYKLDKNLYVGGC